jgi:hypothetical protein
MSENEMNTETQDTTPENQNTEKELSYDELKAELKKVRQEAASRRISNRELEEKARQWEEYEESQKTELQKLQDELTKKNEKLSGYELADLKRDVVKEFKLESEDAELLTGSDEATIRKQAEKLQTRLGKKEENTTSPSANLLAGNRGTPIGSSTNFDMDDVIRKMARGGQ